MPASRRHNALSTATRVTTLAPFHFRAFRFQWPADLAASCAFEMEGLILSWYILIETQSVFLLSAYASLQYLGTLISPLLGVIGDRLRRFDQPGNFALRRRRRLFGGFGFGAHSHRTASEGDDV